MRIAVLTSSFPATGEDPSGHFVRTEVQALIEAGHEVTVLLPRATGTRNLAGAVLRELPHLGLFGWPGAMQRLRRAPWRLLGLGPYCIAAQRQIARHGPFDQLVAHWIFPAFWPICRDFDQETLVVVHGSDLGLLERLPAWWQQSVLDGLGRPNVRTRCVSNELARRLQRLAQTHGAPAFEISIEPSALAIPPLPARSELRRELRLTAAPLVVIVGRVVKAKRIDQAIFAIVQAAAEAGGVQEPTIAVIGDGPMLSVWRQRFPSVRWLGQLGHTDTLRYIGAADLLVSASPKEGAPTVVREARALGTEVVAANAGDLAAWSRRDPGLLVVEPFTFEPGSKTCQLIARRLRGGPVPTMPAITREDSVVF